MLAASPDTSPRVTLRLCDGSEPGDWYPRHGDRPCHANGHGGTHCWDACPDLFAAQELGR